MPIILNILLLALHSIFRFISVIGTDRPKMFRIFNQSGQTCADKNCLIQTWGPYTHRS